MDPNIPAINERHGKSGDPFRYPLLKKKEDAWKDCHDLIKKYDDELCGRWKDEINNLLILAGLFSAVVTGFTVESYKWLQQDSGDVSLAVLVHISSQLGAGADNTTARTPFQQEQFSPSSSVVRINTLWFLSLTFSLTTAIMGILCIQWLREYERDMNLSPKDSLALRQMLHEGLKKWHVPRILAALPLILELALVLFFVGLLNLLWTLDRTVAIIAGVFLGLALLFIIITTVLPTFQMLFPIDKNYRTAQCAYKSLQSWAFFRLAFPVGLVIVNTVLPTLRLYFIILINLPLPFPRLTNLWNSFTSLWKYDDDNIKPWQISDWGDFDLYWRKKRDKGDLIFSGHSQTCIEIKNMHYDTIRGLKWINRRMPLGVDANYLLIPCLLDLQLADAIRAIRAIAQPPPPALPLVSDISVKHSLRWLDDQVHEPVENMKDRSDMAQSNGSIRIMMHQHRQSYMIPQVESLPLHREMFSLLAIRWLNHGQTLHPNVRDHYLELYARIRNTATDKEKKTFFYSPLHPVSSAQVVDPQLRAKFDLDLSHTSETGYLEDIFQSMQWTHHIPESICLQLLELLIAHLRQDMCYRDLDGEVLVRWNLLKFTWNIVRQILRYPLPFDNTDPESGLIHSQILSNIFLCCEEISKCITVFSQEPRSIKSAVYVQAQKKCAMEMISLRQSISDLQFGKLKKCLGFSRMGKVVEAMKEFTSVTENESTPASVLWPFQSKEEQDTLWNTLNEYTI